MNRAKGGSQGTVLLLEVMLLLEWGILLPVAIVSFVGCAVGLPAGRNIVPALLLLLLFGGVALLNLACWRGVSWALWIRAAIAFTLAVALVELAGSEAMPGLYVLAVERAMQSGIAVWRAVRGSA